MENICINLDDLDDELLEAENSFESFLGTEQIQLEEPTLESILNEDDDSDTDEVLKSVTQSLSREESEAKWRSVSLNTQQLLEKNGIVCKQTYLKQVSSQLKTAMDRSEAGVPTALEVSCLIAIGTSRGLVLLFDSSQVLKLYMTSESKDAISALCLNNSCDRLLVGDSSGLILMYDTNGRLLRKISDAHPAGNAILNLKFTDDPKVAVLSDSGGSVFMLEFKRVMGARSAESQCLFSGSRGEVCHIEPLRFQMFAHSLLQKLGPKSSVKTNLDHLQTLLGKYSFLAMASFTKLFIVTLKPKLTVLFTFALHSPLKYLPILNWQLVILQSDESKRYISPMLTCARHSTIHFFQLDYVFDSDDDVSKKFRIIYSKKSDFSYKILNFAWLNAKTIGILDESEKLHIVDIKSNEELQCLSINVKLVYNSSFFKSLSTGGHVSEALAYAGENSCYQSFRNFLGQLFMLGTDSITLFSLQNWSARIDDFLNESNLDVALDLAVSMHCGETKALIGLPNDTKSRKEKICDKIMDMLQLYVNCAIRSCPSHGSFHLLEQHYAKASRKLVTVCTRIHRQDILFNSVYDLITCDSVFEGAFYESLEDALLSNQLADIPPLIVKKIIKYYKNSPRLLANLEKCLLHFNIANIDFHDVIQTCKKYALTDAYIYLFNKALGDYVTPLEDVLKQMNPVQFLSNDTSKLNVDKSVTVYGNKLLVYLHCCLCGQAYPYGTIDDLELCDDVRRTVFAYLTSRRNSLIEQLLKETDHSHLSGIEFPIMKIFLSFDVMDFLNVITMSFNEPSFEAVIGLDKKQHLIDILIQICLKQNDVNTTSYVNNRVLAHLFMFLARQVANKNNNIRVDDAIFVQMIEYLCNREELDRVEEREQTLIGLLNAVSIQLLERFDLERLLDLCKRAKFYRASEILYEFKSEYCEIIDCYLSDDVSDERHAQVFDLVRAILKILFEQIESSQRQSFSRRSTISEPRDVQLKKLNEKLSRPEVIERMLKTNAAETVHLLWIELNLDLKSLVTSIKDHRQVLFSFLTSLLDLLECIRTNRKYINYISQFSGEYCELYVDLICQFEPHNLINILKSSLNEYSFRIDECIRICREREHVDGLAYLLEKSGQIESAFNLHLEKINSLIKNLQKNVEMCSELELDTIKHSIDALLVMIVKLCQTHSCSLDDSVREKIWFSLFDEVMRPIQSLFLDQQVKVTNGNQQNASLIGETSDFFKNLGSYIINSMVGYVNLSTIIDRMICDPLYGASNFGDIKPLMLKMMEICAYEQILLDKTNDLVSHDVYCKMAAFKTISSKSYSSLSNYCQSCSKQLDSDTESQEVLIFHCGHSFHQMCVDQTDVCSICHSTSNGIKMSRSKKKEKVYAESRVDFFMDDNSNSSNPSTSKSIVEEKAESVSDGHFLNLGGEQINALRSLRSRNASIFKITATNAFVEIGTNLERNSQLALAPANLINFI